MRSGSRRAQPTGSGVLEPFMSPEQVKAARSDIDLEAERQESGLHEKGTSLAVLRLLVFAGDVEVASLRLELSEFEEIASEVNTRGRMNAVELEDPLRPSRKVGAEESVER